MLIGYARVSTQDQNLELQRVGRISDSVMRPTHYLIKIQPLKINDTDPTDPIDFLDPDAQVLELLDDFGIDLMPYGSCPCK